MTGIPKTKVCSTAVPMQLLAVADSCHILQRALVSVSLFEADGGLKSLFICLYSVLHLKMRAKIQLQVLKCV